MSLTDTACYFKNLWTARATMPPRMPEMCIRDSSEAASSEAAGESIELIVFAAASLTETLNAIAQDYSAENPGVTFRFNFDSSGTLKTQIQEGADCDLFLSCLLYTSRCV